MQNSRIICVTQYFLFTNGSFRLYSDNSARLWKINSWNYKLYILFRVLDRFDFRNIYI